MRPADKISLEECLNLLARQRELIDQLASELESRCDDCEQVSPLSDVPREPRGKGAAEIESGSFASMTRGNWVFLSGIALLLLLELGFVLHPVSVPKEIQRVSAELDEYKTHSEGTIHALTAEVLSNRSALLAAQQELRRTQAALEANIRALALAQGQPPLNASPGVTVGANQSGSRAIVTGPSMGPEHIKALQNQLRSIRSAVDANLADLVSNRKEYLAVQRQLAVNLAEIDRIGLTERASSASLNPGDPAPTARDWHSFLSEKAARLLSTPAMLRSGGDMEVPKTDASVPEKEASLIAEIAKENRELEAVQLAVAQLQGDIVASQTQLIAAQNDLKRRAAIHTAPLVPR